MTQEDKNLLLKDLCARLPYGVIVDNPNPVGGAWDEVINIDTCDKTVTLLYDGRVFNIDEVKPYLRPMSSVTEEEKEKLQLLHDIICNENYGDGYSPAAWDAIVEWEDYCNSNHLDYRGLIPTGLALEAPEGIYKTE